MLEPEILPPNSGAILAHQEKANPAAGGDREDPEFDSKVDGKELSLNAEINNKHPLQNTWTFWFYKNDRNKDWEDNQKAVVDFSTVEDFWALYNHIAEVGNLKMGCDYSLFKRGVKPMWEDEHNVNGGRWIIYLNRKQRLPDLNQFWLELMMMMIGEAFGDVNGKYINGAVVSIRHPKVTIGDRIGVWLGSVEDSQAILDIGRKIKECLGISVQIKFEPHAEHMSTKQSHEDRFLYTV